MIGLFSRWARKASGEPAGQAPSASPVPRSHPDGHFYSPLVDPADIGPAMDRIWPSDPQCPGLDFNVAGHQAILTEAFPRFIGEFDYAAHADESREPTRFYINNSQFGWLDCRLLYVLLRHWRPKSVVEVGSGYSSLLIGDVNQRYFGGAIDVTAIEPYPRPFLKAGIPGITRLIESKVQEVDGGVFAALEAGDILFIDSSHVSKTGSDVNHLYFEVLPRLRPGVRVHIHDIFLPEDYPQHWVLGGRHWNEQYLVRALLTYSSGFRVVFGCHFAHLRMFGALKQALAQPGGAVWDGGSLWIERI